MLLRTVPGAVAPLSTGLCSFVQGKLCRRGDHICKDEEGAVASEDGMALRALLRIGQTQLQRGLGCCSLKTGARPLFSAVRTCTG